MKKHVPIQFRPMLYAITVSFTILLASSALGALQDQGFWLITPQEATMKAAMPDAETSEGGPFSQIGRPEMNIGPIVEVVKPHTDKPIGSPVEVIINFKERLAKINLDSLIVEVEKFINIDITDRVKPFCSEKGIHIPDALLPSGKHTIIFYIEDIKGNPTELSLVIHVA